MAGLIRLGRNTSMGKPRLQNQSHAGSVMHPNITSQYRPLILSQNVLDSNPKVPEAMSDNSYKANIVIAHIPLYRFELNTASARIW
jgi:hypothetical protein